MRGKFAKIVCFDEFDVYPIPMSAKIRCFKCGKEGYQKLCPECFVNSINEIVIPIRKALKYNPFHNPKFRSFIPRSQYIIQNEITLYGTIDKWGVRRVVYRDGKGPGKNSRCY